jgi:hypothetical protein
VEIGGQLFTVYHYADVPRPYFYPVLGPDELPMTRKWPMEESRTKSTTIRTTGGFGTPTAASMAWTFGRRKRTSCKIVHDQFLKVQSGKDYGVIKSKDKWIDHDGAVVCTDVRTMRIYNLPGDERMFDFDITLQAPPDKPVVFGDDQGWHHGDAGGGNHAPEA